VVENVADLMAVRLNPQALAAARNPGSLASDDNVEAYIERGVKFMMTGWPAWVTSGAQAFQAKVASALS
jgi:hypothetical protein